MNWSASQLSPSPMPKLLGPAIPYQLGKRWLQLSYTHAIRASSPALKPPGSALHCAQSRDVTIFPTAVMLPVRAETGSCSHAPKATSPTLPRCLLGPVLLHPCHQADSPALWRVGERPALLCVCVSWRGVGPASLLKCHLGQLSSAPSSPAPHH